MAKSEALRAKRNVYIKTISKIDAAKNLEQFASALKPDDSS